jgi:hypothetical protein
MSEDYSGETICNEMKIAATNARRRDCDEFTFTYWFINVDD